MFDEKAYRDICGQMRAPETMIQEVISMKHKTVTHRRPVRALVVLAAAVAALGITAGAVSGAGGVGRLLERLHLSISVQDAQGNDIARAPEYELLHRDGRAILAVDGREIDVTEAMATEGSYTYHREAGDASCILTVYADGTATVTAYDVQGGEIVRVTQGPAEQDAGTPPVSGQTGGSATVTVGGEADDGLDIEVN